MEFNTRLADFEKNAGTMTDSVKQLKETELGQLQQRYRDFSQIAQQDLSKKEQELMLPVFDKANEAVKKISQAGGYLVVFNTSNSAAAGLAYFDEGSPDGHYRCRKARAQRYRGYLYCQLSDRPRLSPAVAADVSADIRIVHTIAPASTAGVFFSISILFVKNHRPAPPAR